MCEQIYFLAFRVYLFGNSNDEIFIRISNSIPCFDHVSEVQRVGEFLCILFTGLAFSARD